MAWSSCGIVRSAVSVVVLAVALAMAFAVSLVVLMLMLVALLHPAFLHEVHRLAAGVVLVAMLGPLLLVTRRHVEVQRLLLNDHGLARDDHRLRDNHRRRRRRADVDAAVDAGLDHRDGDADVGLRLRAGRGKGGGGKDGEMAFHGLSPGYIKGR